MFKVLPQFHHHHNNAETAACAHSPVDARRVIISDGIHNIADGILIATSFAINPIIGIITTLSILIHEFLQEVSEFFVLKQAGYSTQKALSINFITSSTILVGAIPSSIFLAQFSMLELPLLGIAAGAFFVVVLHDLIPHSYGSSKRNKTHYKHIAWFVVGSLLMMLISMSIAHLH